MDGLRKHCRVYDNSLWVSGGNASVFPKSDEDMCWFVLGLPGQAAQEERDEEMQEQVSMTEGGCGSSDMKAHD